MRLFNTRKTLLFATFFSVSVLITACGGGDSNYNFSEPVKVTKAALPHGPIFDPANGKIPSTNDLLFRQSQDGTLDIPNKDNNPVIAAVNELDGFSTTNPIVAEFGIPLDPASLKVGDSIHVFEVVKSGAAITKVVREVSAAEIMAVAAGEKKMTLALVPRVPLKESTSYLVVLTNKIKGTDGKPSQAPNVYVLTKGDASLVGGDYEALEPLRQLTGNMETIASSQSVTKESIVLSWSFTTQSISAVLNAVAANAKAGKIVVAPTGRTTKDLSQGAFPGFSDVYIGTVDVPYYLKAKTEADPTGPLTKHWQGKGGSALTRYNTVPVANSTLTIPLMMSMPNATSGKEMPANGWPVVIYQHGITRVRTDMLVYADALSKAGFALIAIDLPLHGIDTENPFYNFFHASKTPFPNDIEPTFDLDADSDGVSDSSGSHFINLSSLLTSRDNIRQGVSNLLVLRRSLENIPNIDASKVGFIAHSLGGIVGVPYMAVEDKSMPTSLVATGGLIQLILKTSDPFGIQIKEGLAAQGVTGAKYDQFMGGAQFVLDSADPINYAVDAAANHPVHIVEMIGDKVVTNQSTEIIAGLMQAKAVSSTVTDIAKGKPGIVRFTKGIHSTVLSPTHDGTSFYNEFLEIHKQLAAFQASMGTSIVITDDSSIKK